MQTDIHASSGIRTHYLSVQAGEDGSALDCVAAVFGDNFTYRQQLVGARNYNKCVKRSVGHCYQHLKQRYFSSVAAYKEK
jgi:hypothetical protein